MNKKSKKTLIIVSVCILCLLIFYPFISSYISDLKTLKYKEYDKIGDNFVYEFELDETNSSVRRQ